MSSRVLSHQLSNGLYVSGRPEQPKERVPTMSSSAIPYTGGDIKKSGELGKMFDVDGSRSKKSGSLNSGATRAGPLGGVGSVSGQMNRVGSLSSTPPGSSSLKKTNSGPLNKHGEPLKKTSGPQGGWSNSVSRQNSGSLTPVLPATGLITSGPISSGPLNSSGTPRNISGPLDSFGHAKTPIFSNNQAITRLTQDDEYSFIRRFPRAALWSAILLFLMGFIAGGFILGAVHNSILLIMVVVMFILVAAVFTWNTYWGRQAVVDFINSYPDSDLRTAKDGQFVKVSGVVTCGNTPLESSFQKVPRCVYTSTSLYEYRDWKSKPANVSHRHFTWSLRSLERHVVDFYISDLQSGFRALVKAGYGAKVMPYVDESVVIDVNRSNRHLSPEFTSWLQERKLSTDNDRVMRLKEGCVKEGSTVSVIGVVQRNDNVLMIVPPLDPFSTGGQWFKCVFPVSLEGIVLRCEDGSLMDAIPV